MTAIHQICAGFARSDAISNEALTLRGLFRSWGHASLIFAEKSRTSPDLRNEARDIGECAAACGPDDAALLHLSIGSPVNRAFHELKCRKAILYHNVTPPRYFSGMDPEMARRLQEGREQIRSLAGAAEVNLADSRFNASELESCGYRDVRVFPLVFDPARLAEPPNRRTVRDFRDGKVNVLFVGRCVPNKKFEDLLIAFAYFQRTVEPESRLILAGSWAGSERYYQILSAQARRLGLRPVEFLGSVPQGILHAAYAAADLFLCMSEHEGFCIPLLEAMMHDVPVLAYAAAAVPETLDGAGVLFDRKDFPVVAELMGRLARDRGFRGAVLAGQRARLARYFARDPGAELRGLLAPLLARKGAA